MNNSKSLIDIRSRRFTAVLVVSCIGLFASFFYVYGQDKSEFPGGYDAVQTAPESHKVIFENTFVRVLEVSVSPNTTVPMHHHRWPSLLVSWDNRRQVTARALPQRGWHCEGYPERGSPHPSRHLDGGVDEAGANALR
jgi:hypothetical protein